MTGRKLLCLAHMSGNEMKYVQEAFDTNWVVPLGPNVNAFEEDLKSFVESQPDKPMSLDDNEITRWPQADWAKESGREVVALSAGTAAVHLSLVGCGVEAGDEVICQSFTFSASSNPIRYLGATPVFVDSENETWNIDPDLLEAAIIDRKAKTGKYPKAIVVVYLYGMPAKIDEIMAIASKYNIPLIEDAAEALGSRYNGRVCGTYGRYGILSFNGNKMITTSGGGALICPELDSKREMMFYATQARESFPYYQHEKIGYNYRMSNICAGIGRGQMTILDEHIAHHKSLAAKYAEAFSQIPGITFHAAPSPKYDANYWLNTIVLDPDLKVVGQDAAYSHAINGAVGGAAGVTHQSASLHTDSEPNANVEAMRIHLEAAAIESRPLWKPMHLQPVYAESPAYVNGVSEDLFKTGLCLPSGPCVSFEDVDYIVEAIKSAIIR